MSLDNLKALDDNQKIEQEKNSLKQEELLKLKTQFKNEQQDVAQSLAKTQFSLKNEKSETENPTLYDIIKAIDNEHYLNGDNAQKATIAGDIPFTINGKQFMLGWHSELGATIQSFLVAAGYNNKLGRTGIDGKIGTATLQGIEKFISKTEKTPASEKKEESNNMPENLEFGPYYDDFKKSIDSIKVFMPDFDTMFTSYRAKKLGVISKNGLLNNYTLDKKNNTINFTAKNLSYSFEKNYSIPLKDVLDMNGNKPEISIRKFPKQVQNTLEKQVFADYNKTVINYFKEQADGTGAQLGNNFDNKIKALNGYKIRIDNEVNNDYAGYQEINAHIDGIIKNLTTKKNESEKKLETSNKAYNLEIFMEKYKVNVSDLPGKFDKLPLNMAQRNFLNGFKNNMIEFKDVSIENDSLSGKKVEFRLNNPYFDNKKTDYLSINLINKDGKVDENRVKSWINSIIDREIKNLAQ